MILHRKNTYHVEALNNLKCYAKWIPCTVVGDNDGVSEGDWDSPIYGSGRWGIYTRGINSNEEQLVHVVESPTHQYRNVSDDDIRKIRKRNRYLRAKEAGFMNVDNYSESKEVHEFNRILKEKEKKRQSEENREKGKEMWGPITGRPYIQGMSFKEG